MVPDDTTNRVIYIKCPYHDRAQSNLLEGILQTCVLLVVGVIIFSTLQETPSRELAVVKHEMVAQYHLKQAPANTAAKPWKNQTNVAQLKPILQRLLKRHNYHVLCMHHVEEMEVPYRACMVANRPTKQYYLLLNPEVVGHSTRMVPLHQTSVACEKPFQSPRYETIFVQWLPVDYTQSPLYARFDDATAIELQIAMDEFQGNFHCGGGGVPKRLQASTVNDKMGTQL